MTRSTKKLLSYSTHRPWKMPAGNWKFYQEWRDVVFLHWQVDSYELQKFIPKGLELDLFEGNAWASIVAFTMKNVRVRNLPSFPPISNFHEINLRTYVRCNKKSGVYFLSIEGGKMWSCSIAKAFSQLPYQYAKMSRNQDQFRSINKANSNQFDIKYSIGENILAKNTLDRWLTERYALFQETSDSLLLYEIHHIEWPLKTLSIREKDIQYPHFDHILAKTPHKLQYSPGVSIVAWNREKIS